MEYEPVDWLEVAKDAAINVARFVFAMAVLVGMVWIGLGGLSEIIRAI